MHKTGEGSRKSSNLRSRTLKGYFIEETFEYQHERKSLLLKGGRKMDKEEERRDMKRSNTQIFRVFSVI